ncbi:hypothetical protein DM01DRAFT_1333525 [Hesseltinella vesiculosa]|uniref:Phosphatidylglycerol/phosphatidylinositol transfer protein n=1 Tax=Hesseltinella vesiculosa TaxID=101127 RepID=A0A1X2GQ82_9FUNG|nr:hypothetical protein DM01DRAFT_1333525 [Hesseltinella vesiculosa]
MAKFFILQALMVLGFLCMAQAQRIFIQTPTNGQKVKLGQKITVQIVRPIGLQGSIEAGLAIGLYPCSGKTCPKPATEFGDVLYHGQYNPQRHELPGHPYQNFTITLPSETFYKGNSSLNVGRFHLIGAGPSANLELESVTLQVS